MSKIDGTFFGQIRTAAAMFNDAASLVNPRSIIEVGRETRIEPLTLIDASVADNPIVNDVLSSILVQYATFFTLAAQAVLNVDRIEVIRRLDTLNPNRSLTGPIANNLSYGKEELLSLNNLSARELILSGATVSVGGEASVSDDKYDKMMREESRLSLGKLVRITTSVLDDNEEDTSSKKPTQIGLNVQVRLKSMVCQSGFLTDVILNKAEDVTLSGRWSKMNAFEITGSEFISGSDVLKRRMRLKAGDKEGVLDIMDDRRRKGMISTILSGKISLNQISGIMVISSETRDAVERSAGISFTNFNKREALFSKLSTMIFAVMDDRSETVTFYYKSIDGHTRHTFSQIASNEKRSGSSGDVTSMLQAFKEGQRPKFI